VAEQDADDVPAGHQGARSIWPDVLGILWIVGAAFVALVPALVHGPNLGSFDLVSTYGLTAHPGAIIHNAGAADISDEVIPWIQSAWLQVHHGHVPLWLHDEALGMPLAFNFGSGTFSLPALVSYLAPLSMVLWVQVLVSLVVGGTGAYFFGRVLRLHPVACAFAGTTWVLSGPFWGYLGLPDTSVMSWAGWQFAAVVLILRGRHRFWSVVLFAVAFAFSILAGNPQIEVIILLPLAVFVAVVLLWRCFVLRTDDPVRRPIVDLVLAGVAGAGLSAPLFLPGIQLANASIRTVAPNVSPDLSDQVLGLIFQSFWGQPLRGSFINPQGYFEEQWLYVGAIAVALAVAGVAVRWRRPEVVGLAVGAVVATLASIVGPIDSVLDSLPAIGHTWWLRSVIPLAFLVAMLGAVGLDAVMRRAERRAAIRWALGAFGVTALVLALVWLFWRGHLSAHDAAVRAQSFVWPVVSTLVGVGVLTALAIVGRRSVAKNWSRRTFRLLALGAAGALLTTQTVFLVLDDGPIPSSSAHTYPQTQGVTALKQAVGSSVVGLGIGKDESGGFGLGLNPDANVAYGIDEFAVYDPIVPRSFFSSWNTLYKTSAGVWFLYEFVPSITSAQMARRYGISYVLEQRGAPGPAGSVFDRRVGNEDLYRIPGAAMATLVTSPSSEWPSADAPGQAVPMTWPGPSRAHVVTDSSSPGVLRLRVSAVPGWKATIDGRPLALSPYLTTMLQAHVPAGRHVIELHYWPTRFTAGLVVAGLTVVVLVVVGFAARRRRGSPDTSVDNPPLDTSDDTVSTESVLLRSVK
jgi:Bacterial membrane protein YfhO